MSTRLFVVLAVTAFTFAGCGGETGPEKVTVTGKVTLNGEPIPQGDIIFRAAGQGNPYAGKIENGSYSFETEPGSKKVEITSFREVPGETREDNPGEIVNVTEQVVPEAYNKQTTLTAEVSSDKTEFDFALEGTPPKSK